MWSAILDIVFPPRPTERVLRALASAAKPLPQEPASCAGHFALLPYQDSAVQAAIIENKYYHNSVAATLLGAALTGWLETLPGPVVCIPVPLSTKRQRERGYNQVTEVLKTVGLPAVSVAPNVLVRTRHTIPQTSLARTARLKNVRGAFTVHTPALSELHDASTVVIVDDVLTTGATLEAAHAVLAPHLRANTTLKSVALAH